MRPLMKRTMAKLARWEATVPLHIFTAITVIKLCFMPNIEGIKIRSQVDARIFKAVKYLFRCYTGMTVNAAYLHYGILFAFRFV